MNHRHAHAIALHMRRPLYRARPQFANMRPGGSEKHRKYFLSMFFCNLQALIVMVLSNAINDLEVVLVMNIMMVIRVLKSQRAGLLLSVLS